LAPIVSLAVNAHLQQQQQQQKLNSYDGTSYCDDKNITNKTENSIDGVQRKRKSSESETSTNTKSTTLSVSDHTQKRLKISLDNFPQNTTSSSLSQSSSLMTNTSPSQNNNSSELYDYELHLIGDEEIIRDPNYSGIVVLGIFVNFIQ
jgi:hypothetical protein